MYAIRSYYGLGAGAEHQNGDAEDDGVEDDLQHLAAGEGGHGVRGHDRGEDIPDRGRGLAGHARGVDASHLKALAGAYVV